MGWQADGAGRGTDGTRETHPGQAAGDAEASYPGVETSFVVAADGRRTPGYISVVALAADAVAGGMTPGTTSVGNP